MIDSKITEFTSIYCNDCIGAFMAKLTAKQQRFVDEYIIDLNATQAAIRAGDREKHCKLDLELKLYNQEINKKNNWC